MSGYLDPRIIEDDGEGLANACAHINAVTREDADAASSILGAASLALQTLGLPWPLPQDDDEIINLVMAAVLQPSDATLRARLHNILSDADTERKKFIALAVLERGREDLKNDVLGIVAALDAVAVIASTPEEQRDRLRFSAEQAACLDAFNNRVLAMVAEFSHLHRAGLAAQMCIAHMIATPN